MGNKYYLLGKKSLIAASLVIVSGLTNAAVPPARIIGPTAADEAGTGTLHTVYGASTIELIANGHIEEESFIEGRACCRDGQEYRHERRQQSILFSHHHSIRRLWMDSIPVMRLM